MFFYYFVNFNLRVEIIFRTERTVETVGLILKQWIQTPMQAGISPLADTLFWLPLGDKAIWIFSYLRVSTFWEDMMGGPNRQLLLNIDVFYRPEQTKGGTTRKLILTIFKYKNGCYKQLEHKKVDEKMGSFVWFPCFLPELWSLNYPKKCIFCNSVLTSARNLSVKAIYIDGSESFSYSLSENDMPYRDLSHRS